MKLPPLAAIVAAYDRKQQAAEASRFKTARKRRKAKSSKRVLPAKAGRKRA